MNYVFHIEKLDIAESYFKGKVRFGKDEFTINIQNERRGKVLRLPFLLNTQKRVLVRVLVLVSSLKTLLNIEANQNGLKLILIKSHFTLLTIRTSLTHLR